MGYPCRGIRTADFLYIRNLEPERWPAGDPEKFGDVDDSPSKDYILTHRDDSAIRPFFQLAFAKRPAEELYDLRKDPAQLTDIADQTAYTATKKKLQTELEKWMQQTGDPRANNGKDPWDTYPYYSQDGRTVTPKIPAKP